MVDNNEWWNKGFTRMMLQSVCVDIACSQIFLIFNVSHFMLYICIIYDSFILLFDISFFQNVDCRKLYGFNYPINFFMTYIYYL